MTVRAARRSAKPSESREHVAIQPPPETQLPAIQQNGERSAAARFRIFIVDSGWNSAARRVLHENFALIRDLQKDDPIYVLSREKSVDFMRRHGSRIGRDPIIAVHDMQALIKGGTAGFHGFRLSLGLLRTPSRLSWGCKPLLAFWWNTATRQISRPISAPGFAGRGSRAPSRSPCIMRRAKSVSSR